MRAGEKTFVNAYDEGEISSYFQEEICNIDKNTFRLF